MAWEQNGHPIIYISRRLSAADRRYLQTQRKAPTVHWTDTRSHKHRFGTCYTLVTDYEALKSMHDSHASLAKSYVAMVQRWDITLSIYSCNV